jgi:hypothetical protein
MSSKKRPINRPQTLTLSNFFAAFPEFHQASTRTPAVTNTHSDASASDGSKVSTSNNNNVSVRNSNTDNTNIAVRNGKKFDGHFTKGEGRTHHPGSVRRNYGHRSNAFHPPIHPNTNAMYPPGEHNDTKLDHADAGLPLRMDDKSTQTSEFNIRKLRLSLCDSQGMQVDDAQNSPRAMLMNVVVNLRRKLKITKEVELALVHYIYTQAPLSKEAEDICRMEEDHQVIALTAIAEKHPYESKHNATELSKNSPIEPPKSWLQQTIEEELGPGVPYLITGPDIWNRLEFGSTILFALHLIYTNNVEKDVPQKGLRFRKVPFELPVAPPKEWFVVDMCNNIKACDITVQEFTARLRRLVAEEKFNKALLREYAQQFGNEHTKDIIEDSLLCYVHQCAEFPDWVRQTAALHQARDAMILRDYLITHVLYSLKMSGKDVFLKGGCSLSLGYDLITRTSEDVDLRIEPSVGVVWEVNGREDAEVTRTEFFLKLRDSIFVEDGEVKLDYTKCKTTQAVYQITFNFPLIHPKPITILLEVMHKVAPLYVPCPISSKMHEFVRKTGTLDTFKNNHSFDIACVHPIQTLYEKIHAIHQNFNKFQRTLDGNINAPKWIRHLGDAYNIIKHSMTPLPEDWTIERLQEELARSGDFVTNLSPDHPTLALQFMTDEERLQVEDAYKKHLTDAYYGMRFPPDLEEVCRTIAEWLKSVPRDFISLRQYERTRRDYSFMANRFSYNTKKQWKPNPKFGNGLWKEKRKYLRPMDDTHLMKQVTPV